ncbi:hypothetical protein OQA88_4749 [Cercophora sp. LCS_1]
MIAPTFESLSTKYSKPKKITFCKVDVDSQGDVAQQYSVRAMPTFLVLHNGSVIETIQGANPQALTAAVEKAVKIAGPGGGGGSSFGSPGHRLGGTPVSGGRTVGGSSVSRPFRWDLSSIINAIYTFLGLYFNSLFSLDPYKSAENSQFNRPRNKGAELHAEDIETIVRQARQTFGQTLPHGYLSEEEYKLYVRLYGPPLRETQPEDVGIPYRGENGDIVDATPRNGLFRELEHGMLEEVEYTTQGPVAVEDVEGASDEILEGDEVLDTLPPLTEGQIDYLNITANNQREYDALIKLQRDFEAASLEARIAEETEEAEEVEENPGNQAEEDLDRGYDEMTAPEPDDYVPGGGRTHPNTALGQWGPNPSTIFLPHANFVQPISELLKRTDIKHVKQTAERLFGGPGLPHSPATPIVKGPMGQRPIQLEAGHSRMGEIEADAYIATVMPGVYASVMSALVEVRKRLGAEWLRGLLKRDGDAGPRVLDIGAGGAGLAAWQEVLQAEWDVLHEGNEEVKAKGPPGKKTVIVGSNRLRHRISQFLQNTTFLPRLPDYMHSVEGSERQLDSDGLPRPQKRFDVIIASHILLPLEKQHRREEIIDNLWKMLEPNGGVLIVLEKGHPRGFEAVADVRRRMLDEFFVPPRPEPTPEEIEPSSEHVREQNGMIIAPCTNHSKCPMYLHAGLSPGRKDYCHFDQRFIRPPFLQQILGSSHRNHEDIKFSYVAIRRGAVPDKHQPLWQGKDATDRAFAGYENLEDSSDAPNPFSLPRNVRPPLKRHGHVTMELCTPAGRIERWVVPKSFSKQAYRDARKAQWGDLWALGAKTRSPSNIRLGRAGQEDGPVLADGGVRAQRAAEAARGRKRLGTVDIHAVPGRGIVGVQERQPKGWQPTGRRTKGGKLMKIDDLFKEAGLDKEMDPEEKEDMEWLQGR